MKEKVLLTLYAIHKNGTHLGNERGQSPSHAIANYVIASQLEEFLDDAKFMSNYSAVEAEEGIHYTLSHFLKKGRSM